jgi:outer membrane protein assembly factor BamB
MKFSAKPVRKTTIAKDDIVLTADPTVSGSSVYIGDTEGEIVRIDPPFDRVVWQVPADGFYPQPGVCKGLLVLISLDGAIRALDASSGRVVWTVEEDEMPWMLVGERLLAFREQIAVGDVLTAKLVDRWNVDGASGTLGLIGNSEQTLVLSDAAGEDPMRGFDVERKAVIWQRDLKADVLSRAEGSPRPEHFALYGTIAGRAIVQCGRTLFGLSLADGHFLWQHGWWIASRRPVMYDDRLYFWARTPDGRAVRFVCLDEATGQIVYDHSLEALGEMFRGQDAGFIAGDHIAFGGAAGLIAVFRLVDGELAWLYQHRSGIDYPMILGDHLVALAGGGKLLVFERTA